MGTSGILQLQRNRVKSQHRLLLFMLLGWVLAVLPGQVKAQPNFHEEFTYDDATSSGPGWNSLNTASVLSNELYYISTVGGESYDIWQTSTFNSNCSTPFVVIGTVGGTGVDSAYFEYSVDGSSWYVLVNGAEISGSPIQLRLRIENIISGETVTLDNVTIYEKLTYSLSSTNITCHGLTDGTITVSGECGYDNGYHYVWGTLPSGFPDPGDNGSIINAVAGDYQVTVSNGYTESVISSLISIIDPDSIYFSVGGQDWSCDNPPGCNGSITVTPSGGTPPYKYFLDAIETPHPFTNQCGSAGGTVYNVDVSDVNNCTTTGAQQFTIYTDETAPACDAPERYVFLSPAVFGAFPQVVDTMIRQAFISTGGLGREEWTYTINNSASYNNLQLQILATLNGTVWTTDDTIKVVISYDEGSTWGSPIVELVDTGAVLNTWVSLNNNLLDIRVRVICNSASGHYYDVQHLYARGNNTASSITTIGPTNCIDNYDTTPTISPPSDGPINWLCNTPGNLEFNVDRTWTVTDDCGNPRPYIQTIAVGTAPTFLTQPRDTTLDFCNYTNINITGPVAADNCLSPVLEHKIIRNSDNSATSWTSGDIVNHTFTQPVSEGESYTIRWKVTDNAGFTDSIDKTLTFLPVMEISFNPLVGSDHFCSGETASFTISVAGGTGSYQDLIPGSSILPIGTWNDPDHNGSGTYTTSNLVLGATEAITVNYTDNNFNNVVGGCSTGNVNFSSGVDGFTIHQKISTNPLNRD